MNPHPEGCRGCPADHLGLGFVPPTTPPGTLDLIIVGQGPGEQEAQFSQPFYPSAPSGGMLRDWIRQVEAKLGRTLRVAFGNVTQCWVPKQRMGGELGKGSRDPLPEEVAHCWQYHVGPWLHSLPPEVPVVAVGAASARRLLGLGDEAVGHLMGQTFLKELPPI